METLTSKEQKLYDLLVDASIEMLEKGEDVTPALVNSCSNLLKTKKPADELSNRMMADRIKAVRISER